MAFILRILFLNKIIKNFFPIEGIETVLIFKKITSENHELHSV